MNTSVLPLSMQDINETAAALMTPATTPTTPLEEVLPIPWRPCEATRTHYDIMLSTMRGETMYLGRVRIAHMDTGSSGPWADDMRIDYLEIYKDLPTGCYIVVVENNGGVFGGGPVDFYLALTDGMASFGDLLVTLYGPHVDATWAGIDKIEKMQWIYIIEEILAIRLYNIAFNKGRINIDVHVRDAVTTVHTKTSGGGGSFTKAPTSVPALTAAAAAPKIAGFQVLTAECV